MEIERALDDVDWQLLRELQVNARISFSELGRRVGLTSGAVAERVRRMEAAGVISGYRLELNLERAGLPVSAIVRLTLAEGRRDQIGALARECPEVLECHRVTGDDSYIMKVAVRSVEHLEAFLDRLTPHGQSVTAIVLSSPVTHRLIGPAQSVQTRSERLAGERHLGLGKHAQ